MPLKLRLLYKIALIVLLFTAGLIIAGVIYPYLNLMCFATEAKRKRDWLKMAWLKAFSIIIGLKVTQTGQQPIKLGLLVSNHISWLDIIVLGQFFPVYFVAKSDIKDWPVVGYLAKQGGTIFAKRGEKQRVGETAESMIWHLKQQSMVVVFPEGTTTRGDDVLPFHASLFQPALLTKAPIQVAAIQYLGDSKGQAPFVGEDAFVPHLLKMLSLDKIEARVDFGTLINTAGKNRQLISQKARGMILESITGDNQGPMILEPALMQGT